MLKARTHCTKQTVLKGNGGSMNEGHYITVWGSLNTLKNTIQPFPRKTFLLSKKIKVLWEKNQRALCWKINVLLSSVLVEKNKLHNKHHKQWGNIYHTGLLARPQRMSRPTGFRRGSTCCHINVFKRSPVEKFQEVGMPLVEWVTTPHPTPSPQ